LVRRPERHQELCLERLRSRRADGQRVLALGHLRHSADGHLTRQKNAGDPKSGKAPAGALQSRDDYGITGYGGPCPPKGDKPHHYRFTIYAVDVDKLDADENASAAVIGFNLHFHTLAKATLTGIWGH